MTHFLISIKHIASGRLTHRRLLASSQEDAGRRAIELIVGPDAMAKHDAEPRYAVTNVVSA
jgi:hypothetical protein